MYIHSNVYNDVDIDFISKATPGRLQEHGRLLERLRYMEMCLTVIILFTVIRSQISKIFARPQIRDVAAAVL